ncbi:MAG: hypothetical protein KatS3mg057_2892 [Herpetosiphonaceae bacterium]|nr:MAG: hypothetical protein KatS3mg057_2892 [Herpetosiphonaceae bacterium]
MLQAVTDAAKGHDLAVLTASGDTILNQLFAGSTADRLAEELTLPVIVVKRYRGLTQRWLRRVWRSIDALLPSLTDEDQIDVYKRVRRGARGTIDFYTLLLLAVVIATMGLLLNSGAVIIGAMLVAPLMTPILAIGLGVVMGDLRLLRVAAESTVRGIILALLVSILLTWIAPFVMFTTEITARTQPNLFDLTVALAAGGAGAYGISRKHIAAALSGVAVAAALVPPLSVVGICIATGRWPAASGAALLFGTNLVAISLAAAVIYLLLGFFPQAEDQKRHLVLRYGFLSSLLLLFALTLPLARSLEQDATRATTNQALRDALEQVLSEETNLSLFNFDWEAAPGQPIFLKVIVYARDEVTVGTLDAIEDATSSATGREVNVQLVIIPTDELRETDTTR